MGAHRSDGRSSILIQLELGWLAFFWLKGHIEDLPLLQGQHANLCPTDTLIQHSAAFFVFAVQGIAGIRGSLCVLVLPCEEKTVFFAL